MPYIMLENNKNDHNGGNNTIYILKFNKPNGDPILIVIELRFILF